MNHDEKNAPMVDDLTVNEDQAKEVKGGAQVDFFLKLHGVDGDVTHIEPSAPSISETVTTKFGNGL